MRLNLLKSIIFSAGLVFLYLPLTGQTSSTTDTTSGPPVTDVLDVLQRVFSVEEKPEEKSAQALSISLLPVIGYNPSFGAVLGANMVMGQQKGDPANTGYSVYTFGLTYGSKGILTLQHRHNVFMPGNKWNFQGNWQFSKYGLIDHALGTNNDAYCEASFIINEYPTTAQDSSFPIKYNYIRLFEKGYRSIGSHIYAGIGVSLDIYDNIIDVRLSDTLSTPHQIYSLKHGYNPKKYSANGLLIAFQYNSREHPIRSYGGIYFDINMRFDQKWMGSTSNSVQVLYDFRKYWSLSKRNPEHVIAIWHWASYLIDGNAPYLELPYTGSDTYNRSGRAYTIGYFRGPSYAYFESEYRYPITRNKLISGVVFMNFQSASDDANHKIFSSWRIGGGAGLRLLFQKDSRSAVCVDFSRGECGSSGIFFGLNEVF